MSTSNPYAAPTAPLTEGTIPGRGYRLEGDVLVLQEGARLPKLCLKTGQKGPNEHSHDLVYVPMWARFLLGAFGPLIASRKVHVTYHLSDQADHERVQCRRVVIASLLVGMGIGAGGIFMDMPWVGLLGLVILFVGIIYGSRQAAAFRLLGIENGEARLKLQPAAAEALMARARRQRAKKRKKKA